MKTAPRRPIIPRRDARRDWGNGTIVLLSTREAGKLVGVTLATIHSASNSGGPLRPYAVTPSRRRLFLAADVESWMQARGGRGRRGQRGTPETAERRWKMEDLLTLYSVQEAGDLVGLTASTVHAASNPDGSLVPLAVTPCGRRLFLADEVRKWMAQRGGRYRRGQRGVPEPSSRS